MRSAVHIAGGQPTQGTKEVLSGVVVMFVQCASYTAAALGKSCSILWHCLICHPDANL